LGNERALVSRARENDRAAFRTIFDRCAPAVHRFLRDMLRDDTAADEATQETFVRAHRGIASIRDDDRLVPWLMGIARNVAREQRRLPRATSDVDVPEPVSHSTPESTLQGRQTQHALDGALAQLSEPRRAALLLRVDHGLPYERIAETLGWSLAKVKIEIHRARQQLREWMGPHLENPR
jgi:RNA polymerase sigma-70 factor (ECF subfamily)